jgi:uncharacterized repeat protein (TIGR01451 family)
MLTISTTVASQADLSIHALAPGAVITGQALTCTLTITNYGPSTATSLVLSNTLPPGLQLVHDSGNPLGVCGNPLNAHARQGSPDPGLSAGNGNLAIPFEQENWE